MPQAPTTDSVSGVDRNFLNLRDSGGADPPTGSTLVADAVVLEPSLPSKFWGWIATGVENVVGVISIMFGVAVLATVPILQFFSLGYLLEVSGRIASTGRIRTGFVGIREAAHVGGVILGTWLCLLPLRFISDLWYSAFLIDSTSAITRNWRIALTMSTVLMVGHIILAWYCGGRLRHFFWPILAPLFLAGWIVRRIVASKSLRPIVQPVLGTFSPRFLAEVTYVAPLATWFPPAILLAGVRRGGMYQASRDRVWNFFSGIQLRHYFSLGLRGFLGGLIWISVPGLMLFVATRIRGIGPLIGFVGAIILGWIVLHLPFLQTNFAIRNEFRALFEIGKIREQFRRAPIAFWLAIAVTLLFAVPLYLLKIEATPREVTWLPSLFFVVFIYPARFLTGWAMSRSFRRVTRRHWIWRVLTKPALVPIAAWYVLIVFFAQFTSWHGAFSLFEQHAFLLPIPFLGI